MKTNMNSPEEFMKILTPNGFKSFDGVKRYWHEKCLEFTFDDHTHLKTSHEHKFIVNDKVLFAKDVVVGRDIGKVVSSIQELHEPQFFYDPVNVKDGSIFNHDDSLVSHNTFFGTGNTLIEGQVLLDLRAREPARRLEGGDLLVYEDPKTDHQYIMVVDVCQGRGQDYSTFNIIDVSVQPFQQVCVYRNNRISPILYPNILYKYGTLYNEAYVVIENNDQGMVVCVGLYQDLEYENIHLESAVKADSIGIRMDKKVKRMGCSAIKDLIEAHKINIVDENTIMEISTFVGRGISYEASDGNHDDLMMNLVLFGYFIGTQSFGDVSDVNIKEMLFEQRMREIEDDVPPFGIIDDGISYNEAVDMSDPLNAGWHDISVERLANEDW